MPEIVSTDFGLKALVYLNGILPVPIFLSAVAVFGALIDAIDMAIQIVYIDASVYAIVLGNTPA